MTFTNEQLKKIFAAETADELIALAKAEGIDLTEEEIRAKFDAIHADAAKKEGELSDDELDNVAGGGCYSSDGRLIVTCGNTCVNWSHINCGGSYKPTTYGAECTLCGTYLLIPDCNHCQHCTVENAIWYCNNKFNRK